MFREETPRRVDGVLQCFQWRHQGERMEDSHVSSGDTKESGWRTPMFPVETPRREDGVLQCFLWKHQGERMEVSNFLI